MSARVLIVVGTGTDAGKTHVTCALLHAARARRLVVAALKPVATGCASHDCEDALAHAVASEGPYRAPLYAFPEPISPSLAAHRAGVSIELDPIIDAIERVRTASDIVVVETAGGLFSPFGPSCTNATLVARLPHASTLLVAPDRLGVLHDVTATWRASADACRLDALALSRGPSHTDASIGTNASELERCLSVRVSATFPCARIDSEESLRAANEVFQALRMV